MSLAFGIDVSNWQGWISWDLVNESLIAFVYGLHSDGTYTGKPSGAPMGIGEAYDRNKRLCNKLFGAYHYARPHNTNPYAMSEASVRANDGNPLPAMLDVESYPNLQSLSSGQIIDWVGLWLTSYEIMDGRKPILYANATVNGIDLFSHFATYPKWLAAYPSQQVDPNYDLISKPATRWDIWQFTNRGLLNGIRGAVDKNVTTFSFLDTLINSHKDTAMPSFVGIVGEAAQYILVPGGKVPLATMAERNLYVEAGVMADHTIWYDDSREVDGIGLATAIRNLSDKSLATPTPIVDGKQLATDIVKLIGEDLST